MRENLSKSYRLLSDLVYAQIKEDIIEGHLPGGEKVSETFLAKQLNVSRTPVREAIRKLSMEGFVSLESNSSFYINEFDRKEALEVCTVRRLLEGEAARLAAINLDEQGEKLLQREIDIIDYNEEVKGVSEDMSIKSQYFTTYDIKFHDVIYRIANNDKLSTVSKLIGDRQARGFMAKNWAKTLHPHKFLEQHKEIAKAILLRDPDLAESLARAHIDYIIDLAEDVVVEDND